ncbi:MAG TPA: hypothetical protein PKE37_15670 [Thiomonas arsenitoxydans]|jgi:hypothetical protein|uniref:hypothetical protein n=1 Tax=Thiomonas arsenitoxydans (strain DSM 22701 / CIP 110005 / 3As) TaxID=426114 RepID=UPI002BC6315A|nr:hypothetical protein [Thiomonas arsenitoxydans]HML83193.1 hypothetical protein [Thiomonas arsenitoxydans]
MNKTLPFLALFIALLSGCATRPPRAPLPPAAQLDAQTYLVREGYNKPAMQPGQHLKPVTVPWIKHELQEQAISPYMGVVLAQEYKLSLSQKPLAGTDTRAAAANANSMLTISSAGIESAAGAPALGAASMGFDAVKRLLGAKQANPDAVIAQAYFYRHFSDEDAHQPVSQIAPVLQQQMQILAALHHGQFYGPLAFKGDVYTATSSKTTHSFDFNLNQATNYVNLAYWDISWPALRPSEYTYTPSPYGDAAIRLNAGLHNYTVSVGHLRGNAMLSLDAIGELQHKLPFLKNWYVVFNTDAGASGHEWVVFKDGKVLESIPIRES